jgi:hypothetical protein
MLFKSNLISKRNEFLKNVDESGPKVDQNLNSFNENQSYSNKSIHAKLNALEKQIADLNGMGPQNESTSLYYRGIFFGRNTSSQTFYDCKKITYEKEMKFTEFSCIFS